jgi:galactose mutarotase-like enzyme
MAIRIASDRLAAEVTAEGAELVRLTDLATGNELLWDGDPAFWSGHAPILFPIVGTLRDNRYRWQGHSYELLRHGFARRRSFAPAAQDAGSVTFRIEADAATHMVWPFDFALDMRFAIDGDRLEMRATVTNRGDGAMPTSFGFHPALRWPLPGGAAKTDHVILFDQDEPAPVRRLDADGLIMAESFATPIEGCRLALDDSLFAQDALILDRPVSRTLTYGAPGSTRIAVDYADMPQIAFWMKPGADYLCIEPWQGHSDPAGFDGEIGDKPGMVMIAPGEARDFMMGLRLLAA